MKTYYKIVRTNLMSCYVKGKASVQYKVGEYVKAPDWLPKKNQVLFVFDSYYAANNFIVKMGRRLSWNKNTLEVYTCKVRKKLRRLPSYLSTSDLSRGKLVPSLIFLADCPRKFPLGTTAVREVKLIEIDRTSILKID